MSSESESESDPSTKKITLSKEPVMVSRSYLFEGIPSDVSNMFLENHLLVPGDDGLSAINLRKYASINQAHRQYVSSLLKRDELREIAFWSTRRAIPAWLEKLNVNKKTRIKKSEIENLVEAAPRLYVDCSFDKFIFTARGMCLLHKILKHPKLAELRLDNSMPESNEFLKIQAKKPLIFNDLLKFIEQDFGLTSIKLIKENASNFKNLKIDLSNRNWFPVYSYGVDDNLWKVLWKKSHSDECKNLKFGSVDLGRDVKLNKIYDDLRLHQIQFGADTSFRYVDCQKITLKFLCKFTVAHHAIQLLLDGLLMGDEDAASLIKLIRKNDKNSLKNIDLSSNKIASSATKSLLILLKFNSSIERVVLSNNHIYDKDANLLLEMLLENKNLTELRLDGNYISDNHPIWSDRRVTDYDKNFFPSDI